MAVHPRACGEQEHPYKRLHDTANVGRFIPAHAGNRITRSAQTEQFDGTVHPRACGEQQSPPVLWESQLDQRFIPAHAGNSVAYDALISSAIGSSPRMRGTEGRNFIQQMRVRFIPAHAGNSFQTAGY